MDPGQKASVSYQTEKKSLILLENMNRLCLPQRNLSPNAATSDRVDAASLSSISSLALVQMECNGQGFLSLHFSRPITQFEKGDFFRSSNAWTIFKSEIFE